MLVKENDTVTLLIISVVFRYFFGELSLPYFPSRHESTNVFVMFCILIFFGLV